MENRIPRPWRRTSNRIITFRLYLDPQACDSDDWGPPYGEYPTLWDAMRATRLPLSCWRTDPHCPDETFTFEGITPSWSILAPGAAAEAKAMRVPPSWAHEQ